LGIFAEIGTYPVFAVVNSFRYIFSNDYRSKTHTRWKDENSIYIAGEVIFCSAFTIASIFIVIYLLKEIFM
jgi:hypothetical protein